jgi:hypothetical protein
MGCACEDHASVGSLESPLAGIGCAVGVLACTRGISGGVGGIGVGGSSCSSGRAWITFWVAATTPSFPFLREIDRNQEERSGVGCNAGVDLTLSGLGGGGGGGEAVRESVQRGRDAVLADASINTSALCNALSYPSRYVKVHALNYIQLDDTECKYTTNDSCTIPIPGLNYRVSTTSASSVCLFASILASADRIILESCAAASAGLGETYPRRRRILTYVILFG